MVAGWLFAGAWVALLTPTWAYYGMGITVLRALHAAQAVLGLGVLTFLVLQVRTAFLERSNRHAQIAIP